MKFTIETIKIKKMNKFEIQNSTLIFYLNGRADGFNSEAIDKEIDSCIDENIKSMVLDLGNVDYISSAFLRVCIKLMKKFEKENFSIVNVQPTVLKVFKIANFTEIINIQ
jgi:anti-sigma B factor antagonist